MRSEVNPRSLAAARPTLVARNPFLERMFTADTASSSERDDGGGTINLGGAYSIGAGNRRKAIPLIVVGFAFANTTASPGRKKNPWFRLASSRSPAASR